MVSDQPLQGIPQRRILQVGRHPFQRFQRRLAEHQLFLRRRCVRSPDLHIKTNCSNLKRPFLELNEQALRLLFQFGGDGSVVDVNR